MNQSIVYSRWPIVKILSLCLLAAVLLIFSFPRFNFEILAWFGFVPLFFALKNKPKGKAFLLAYLTGVIFWTGTIYWLAHVTFLGTILLVLYLAVYFGILGLIVSTIDYRLSTIESLLFIPSLWVLLEYIRSHLLTGFPWVLLGYSQYLNLPIIQIADITGTWGVSFLVMMVNVAIKEMLGLRSQVLGLSQKRNYKILFFVFCFLFFVFGYGVYRLYLQPAACNPQPVRISVIQGNIPQELKWDIGSREFIVNKYIRLTAEAFKDNPDLIIWPEAAMPCVLEEAPIFYEKVKEFAKRIKTPLVLGAVTSGNDMYYNSALFISSEGRLLNRYDKLHLVPFGEYIPLKQILPFLETIVPIGDITAGKEYTIFKIQNPKSKIQNKSQIPNPNGSTPLTMALKRSRSAKSQSTNNFAVLICFEDLFPELSRQFVRRGAQLLVNITNDAWYKRSSAAEQHFQASVFRAIENQIYLVRSANTGISGFIEPCGKIISLVQDKLGRDIFIDGYATKELFLSKRNPSFYTRFGDVFILTCLLFVLYGIIHKFKI